MPKNPLEAYKQNRQASLSGRDIEVAVLETAAMNFRKLQQDWNGKGFSKDLDNAVKYNQRVWDIFQTAPCPRKFARTSSASASSSARPVST